MNWDTSIESFKNYLKLERGLSMNTIKSYEFDLFQFKNFIIDTKTGFNASRQPDQLKRYLSHTDRLIILTLKGKSGVERIGKRKIEKINFKDFIKCSKELLGVKLDSTEEQNLSLALKRKPFWL